MAPIVSNVKETGSSYQFELSGVDVSVVNSLRRVILSNIDQLVFRGFPHAENQLVFEKNNTKFNNEFLKHRIQCVPIFEPDVSKFDNFVKNYCVKVNVRNESSTRRDVTTQDFKLVQKGTDKRVDTASADKDLKVLFPADKLSGDHILLAVLMPKVSETDEPEELALTLNFTVGCAKEDSCWNVVSKCAYYNKQDDVKIKKIMSEKTMMEKTKEEQRDFELLDAQRIFIPNHFVFHLTTLGVFSNQAILRKACTYLIERMTGFSKFLENATFTKSHFGDLEPFGLYQTETGYYLRIEDDDYTLGKLIENHLNLMYGKEIYYISFKKDHPHDTHCFVSFEYKNPVELEILTGHLSQVSTKIIESYKTISGYFMAEA
jgi:DNA-directed RNA polymerase alpha subunit